MSMRDALDKSLAQITVAETDQAAAQLAKCYAEAIDSGKSVATHGAPMLAVLESLGLTPRARAELKKRAEKPDAAGGRQNELDAIRAKRAARAAG